MAAHGRPTPQHDSGDERPRYKDRAAEQYRRPEANPYLISHREFGRPLIPADQTWVLRGKWHEEFGREAPLHVEIGSGNGFFLTEVARRNPDWNFLGIEIRYKRTMMVAKKLREAGVTNARISRYHAAFLDDLLEPGSVSGLYVNHPDPWQKERHEKHRLISRWFLEDVVRLLKPGGWFHLKSDYLPNIERVYELIDHDGDGNPAEPLPLQITGRSDDVNGAGGPWPDDIQTNYQRKFLERGLPVYAIAVTRL